MARKPLVDLNFKVPRKFRRQFKRLAVDSDLSMVELLKRCFETYIEVHGMPADTDAEE